MGKKSQWKKHHKHHGLPHETNEVQQDEAKLAQDTAKLVRDVCPECGSEHRATFNRVNIAVAANSEPVQRTCANRWHNSQPPKV